VVKVAKENGIKDKTMEETEKIFNILCLSIKLPFFL
jgi:hypothetical protein